MMMLFFTVAMVHIVALVSPGPDFFFVSQTAVSRSRKEAMMGVLGITCGVTVWAGVALLGLHLIIEKNGLAAYDHYGRRRPVPVLDGLSDAARRVEKNKIRRRLLHTLNWRRAGAAFKGLLTNLSNPKAIIYFGSVFSLFVGDNVGAAARWGYFRVNHPGNAGLVYRGRQPVRVAENAPRLSASGEMD